jgi:serine protease Do
VLSVAGKDVTPDQTLSYIIANLPPGARAPIVLLRDGKRMNITAIVGRRPPEDQLAQQSFDPDADPNTSQTPQGETGSGVLEKALGIRAIPLTSTIAGQLGLDQTVKGVVITDVDANSDAGQKGFTRGVVILSANGQPVTAPAQLEAVVKAAQAAGRSAILLRVRAKSQPEQSIPIRLR